MKVDAAGPGSVLVLVSIPVLGIGRVDLVVGKDGGDAKVLVPVLDVVPEGVEPGMSPFLKELFPELCFIWVSFEHHCASGLQLVLDALDDVFVDPVVVKPSSWAMSP